MASASSWHCWGPSCYIIAQHEESWWEQRSIEKIKSNGKTKSQRNSESGSPLTITINSPWRELRSSISSSNLPWEQCPQWPNTIKLGINNPAHKVWRNLYQPWEMHLPELNKDMKKRWYHRLDITLQTYTHLYSLMCSKVFECDKFYYCC